MLSGISVVSPWFLAGLFAFVAASWLGWVVLRRRRRGVRTVALLGCAIVLSTAGVADAVNRYFAYWPTVGDVVNAAWQERNWPQYESLAAAAPAQLLRQHSTGLVVHLRVADRGSGFGATQALVYLPPQYFAKPRRRFPVVYLFHGSPGVPGDWFRGGGASSAGAAQAAAGRPAIIVAPRMSHGWLDDPECVDGLHERVETHFLRDVVPGVDAALRTQTTRAGRAIGGMSAGGYCALNLGLRHREVVGTIIDMSGFTQPTHSGGLSALFGRGPAAVAAAWRNTPDRYATTLRPGPPTRLWLDCGRDDQGIVAEMAVLAVPLRAHGIAVDLHLRPGGHTFHVWRPALFESLTWVLSSIGGSRR